MHVNPQPGKPYKHLALSLLARRTREAVHDISCLLCALNQSFGDMTFKRLTSTSRFSVAFCFIFMFCRWWCCWVESFSSVTRHNILMIMHVKVAARQKKNANCRGESTGKRQRHNVNCPTKDFNLFKNSPLELASLSTRDMDKPDMFQCAVAIRETRFTLNMASSSRGGKINKHHQMTICICRLFRSHGIITHFATVI